MECLECKYSQSGRINIIRSDNNCFKIMNYNQTHILFNISEIIPNNPIGNCKYFGKVIYYGKNECIEKPNNTYFVINDDIYNTGVIKNCFEAWILVLVKEMK